MGSRDECLSYLIYCRALHELRLNMLPDNCRDELNELLIIHKYDNFIEFLKNDCIGEK